MTKLRAGVIGLRMGAAHARAYANNPDAELVALCDTNEEALHRLAAETGARFVTTSAEELIQRDDLDVINVVTPDHFHAPLTIAALEAGRHVLCEKPMAPTWEECLRMVETADRLGLKLMIGQSCRYAAQYVAVRQALDAGDLGELFFVESEYWNNLEGVGGAGNWRNDPAVRHPFLGGCHALDLTRFVGGTIVEVSAYANHLAFEDQPTDDCIVAQLVFESGALGRALVSSGCKCPGRTTLSAYGTAGTVLSGQVCRTASKPKSEWAYEPLPVPDLPASIDGEVAAFVRAVQRDETPAPDGHDNLNTMAACFAVVESAARGGAPVKVATYP